jgi:hypothetical protein
MDFVVFPNYLDRIFFLKNICIHTYISPVMEQQTHKAEEGNLGGGIQFLVIFEYCVCTSYTTCLLSSV